MRRLQHEPVLSQAGVQACDQPVAAVAEAPTTMIPADNIRTMRFAAAAIERTPLLAARRTISAVLAVPAVRAARWPTTRPAAVVSSAMMTWP